MHLPAGVYTQRVHILGVYILRVHSLGPAMLHLEMYTHWVVSLHSGSLHCMRPQSRSTNSRSELRIHTLGAFTLRVYVLGLPLPYTCDSRSWNAHVFHWTGNQVAGDLHSESLDFNGLQPLATVFRFRVPDICEKERP